MVPIQYADPDPGGNFFYVNLHKLHCLLLLNNLLCFFKLKKTLHKVFFKTKLLKQNPDPHDADPSDPDPQHWFLQPEG